MFQNLNMYELFAIFDKHVIIDKVLADKYKSLRLDNLNDKCSCRKQRRFGVCTHAE